VRNAFAAEITELAEYDERLVLLSGDIGNRLFDTFKERYSDRFYNCGVAEANMTSLAAGLALTGFRPLTYTIAPFAITRCFEQIRVDLCYQKLPVIIVGTGAGLSYASNGATHHSCEDIALLRALPNMTVVCPGDSWELRAALREALHQPGPVYLRIGKKGEPLVHGGLPELTLGKALEIRAGRDVCLLSTGNMLAPAVQCAEQLSREGISARVMSFHTVKPLDEQALQDLSSRYPLLVTIEEHSRLGGLGGAVAEWLADHHEQRTRLLRIGTPDGFFHEAGEQDYARERLGLSVPAIIGQIGTALESQPKIASLALASL